MDFFSFEFVAEQMGKSITGLVHLGAHYAEEVDEYHAHGFPAIWFEGHPEYAAKMLANVIQYPNQVGYEALLSNVDDEEVTFYQTSFEPASSMLKPVVIQQMWPEAASVVREIKLRTKRFDSVITELDTKYNLLVLDVQGAESKVWEGIGKFQDQFDAIISEYSTVEYYENVPQLSDLERLYVGFKRVYPEVGSEEHHADALFVRGK